MLFVGIFCSYLCKLKWVGYIRSMSLTPENIDYVTLFVLIFFSVAFTFLLLY